MPRWIKTFFSKGYYIELLLGLLSAAPLFVEAGVISLHKYWILATGLLFVALSTFQKIKGDQSLEEIIASFSDSLAAEAGKSKNLEEAHEIIKKQRDETETRSRQLEEQNELISRLIKEGLITEKNIYEIIQKYKFFYLFCYQNVLEPKRIENAIGEQIRNPSLLAIDRIGFVRVGSKHNFYVLPYDMLPASLRDTQKIEDILQKFVKEEWGKFLQHIEQKNKRFYDQYMERHPDPANCSYVIASSNINDVIIDYVGYNAFSRAFKDLLHHKIDVHKLKKEIARKKHGVQKFVRSISGELLISGIKVARDRNLILEKEEEIMRNVGIDKFTDYAGRRQELETELRKHFTDTKATRYATHICKKSKKYQELLSLLGITFD